MEDLYYQGKLTDAPSIDFTLEDAKLKDLLKQIESSEKTVNHEKQRQIYEEWVIAFGDHFNVVVVGQGSYYKFLETFRLRYYTGKTAHTYTLHGMNPISMDTFKEKVLKQDEKSFLERVANNVDEHLFIIHCYDSLYLNSRNVCDCIFDLWDKNPAKIHVLLSIVQADSAKILKRQRHKLIFYTQSFDDINQFSESFLKVRIQTQYSTNGGQLHSVDTKTLDDVYQALQADCQKILIYILKYFLEHKSMQFNELFNWCDSQLFFRRPNVLKGYLSELEDHKIIERVGRKEDFRSIRCLVIPTTIKLFLENQPIGY